MSGRTVRPRNGTHQADALLYGNLSRMINRLTGTVIVAFVLVHVVVQALLHVSGWREHFGQFAWLHSMQQWPFVHAILFFSIAFHTLYGLKLLAGDLGYATDYRKSFHVITTTSLLVSLRELARYVGL